MKTLTRLMLCVVAAVTAAPVAAVASDAVAAAEAYEQLASMARALNCYHDASSVCMNDEGRGAGTGESVQEEPVTEYSGFGRGYVPSRE